MGREIKLVVGILCFVLSLHAQDANWLGFDKLNQNNPILPSEIKQDSGISIVLPGLSGSILQSSVPLGSFLENTQGGVYLLNFTGLVDDFESNNTFQGELNIPLVGLDYRKGKNMFSLGYGIKTQSNIQYAKGLIDLYALGNAPFVGENMDLSHQVNINNYHQVFLGFAREMGKINIGGRIKILSGISDLSTPENDLQFYTDPDIYQLSLISENGLIFNTSGVLTYDGIDNISTDFSALNFGGFGSNWGIGLDLGVSGSLDKFSFGVSVLDLGNINWSKETTRYQSSKETIYEGLDLLDFFNDDNDIIVEDSLKQLLDLQESSVNYSTDLYTKLYVKLGYTLSNKYSLTAFYFGDRVGGFNSFGIINNISWNRFQLNISAQYAANSVLFGGGVLIDLEPFQFILSADNVLGIINPEKQNYSSGRLAVNYSF